MSYEEREHRFTPTTLFIVGALLVWMTNFLVVYVFAALACARGFADLRVLGLPIVPVATTLSCVAAAIVTGALLRRGFALMRAAVLSEHARFIGFVAFMTSTLAMIGLVMLALPPLVVSACAR